HRRAQGHRRRPAAEPREKRHGGVGKAPLSGQIGAFSSDFPRSRGAVRAASGIESAATSVSSARRRSIATGTRQPMAQSYDRAADVVRALYDKRISGPPVLDLEREFAAGAAFAEAWRTIRLEALAVATRLEV